MSAGRRCLLLLSFLGCSLLPAGPARGQWSQHELWNDSITPEQARELLKQLQDDQLRPVTGDLENAIRRQVNDLRPDQLKPLMEQITRNPKLREEALKIARRNPDLAKGIKPEDRERLWKAIREADPKGDLTRDLPKDLGKGNGTRPGTPPTFPQPGNPNGGPDTPPVPMPGTPPVAPPPGMGPDQAAPGVPPEPPPPGSMGQPTDTDRDEPATSQPEDRRDRARDALSAIFERNLGPLSENPSLRTAIEDLIRGAGGITDAEGNSLLDALGKEGGGEFGSELGNWLGGGDFNGLGGGGGSSFEWPSFNWGGGDRWGGRGGDRPRSSGDSSWGGGRTPSSSGGSSGWGSGGGAGLDGVGIPLLVLVVVVVVGIILWKVLGNRQAGPATVYDLGGLGPWPVDPRRIATREELVRAFEYLSVMVCGPAAKTWTHGTIAAALADLAASNVGAAAVLARLYELARYAPLDEPLGEDQLHEARRLVCGLAGVRYP